jgi:hypothetical protein
MSATVVDAPCEIEAPSHAPCTAPTPCPERPGPERAGRVQPGDIARFVRDPVAFATGAGAVSPEAFVKAYLEGLERRLSGVVGERHRLATLTAQSLPLEQLLAPARRPGENGGELDLSPRMGPVIVAAAVVQAAAAVVVAGTAVYTALSRRYPI